MDKSLSQYLDLYDQFKAMVCAKSTQAINDLRDEAFLSLKENGLPKKGTENYEMTDIGSMIAPDFGLNIARIPLDVDVTKGFKCGLPHISSSLFFMRNDMWAETKGARACLPEGVEVGPLVSFLDKDESARALYGKLADIANPIVALNSLLVQDGMFIRVKRGVRVERPVQIVNLLENTMPLMAMRRLLIILEEDAELRLLSCDHTSGSSSLDMAAVSVAEVYVGRNARLDIYDMEESSPATRRLSALYLSQQEGSDVLIEGITLKNGQTRNEYHTSFEGPHSTLRLYGLGIEGGSRLLDTYSDIRHNAGECHTDELFKYIVDDEARGAFTGKIYVAPGASLTEAYQNNRNMVGGPKARMFSKPQLEIYNDDVKCSHGSATGQMDPMQVFYMRSRGLDEGEATLLLKQAFMADVIEAVRLPMLKEKLKSLVERHFLGEDQLCGDCEICK